MPESLSSPDIKNYFKIMEIANPLYFSDNSSNKLSNNSSNKSVVKQEDDRNRATKPANKVIRAN
jgi:hypothetical protein